MKHAMTALRILLSVGTIVVAALVINAGDDTRPALLAVMCSLLLFNTVLNMRERRREEAEKKAAEKEETAEQ